MSLKDLALDPWTHLFTAARYPDCACVKNRPPKITGDLEGFPKLGSMVPLVPFWALRWSDINTPVLNEDNRFLKQSIFDFKRPSIHSGFLEL